MGTLYFKRPYLISSLFNFHRYIQSGFFLDFIIKKYSEIFIRNVLIYSSVFFGEKFIIEYITKKIIDSYVFNYNKIFYTNNLNYLYYFTQITSFILYIFFITNIIILLLI